MTIFDLTESELRRRRSMKWQRFGADVLPMWVAEMDCRPAAEVVAAIDEALADGDTGYPGSPMYAEAFAEYAHDTWRWTVDPAAQIVGLPDVMHGLVGLLDHLTEPGAPVVVNPPVYPSFYEYLAWAGRPAVEAPLTAAGRLDLATIEQAYASTPRPAAHFLCNPHNPHGVVPTREELRALAELANRHGVLVLSDEIHAPLVSASATHVPWITVPGGDTGIVVTSASKAWNLPGLKSALAIGGTEVAERLRATPGQVTGGATHLGNIAHTAALRSARPWLAEALAEIEQHRMLLVDLLARDLPEVAYSPGPATYLAWLDCRRLGLADPATHFRTHGKVAFNPGPAFGSGGDGFVRMNLATSPDLITEGVRRMAASL